MCNKEVSLLKVDKKKQVRKKNLPSDVTNFKTGKYCIINEKEENQQMGEGEMC